MLVLLLLFMLFFTPTSFSSDITKIISSKRTALENFKIGSKLSDILSKHQGNLWKAVEKKGEYFYVFYIAHETFRFPLIAHFYNRELADYWITLPSYFLHDALLKELMDLFGKHQKFHNQNDHSVYLWETKEYHLRYEASCTITCFPIYLSVTTTKIMDKKYKPLTKQLQLN